MYSPEIRREETLMRDDKSRKLYEKACQVLVGGVNSPVRAFKSVGGIPRFIVSGKGAYVRDADGNELIDYIASWGALLFGHRPSFVQEALARCAEVGTSFGLPTELEVQIAERVRNFAPHAERIRFVNSGSEATAAAVRLARGATGRSRIVKCAGCYHGAVDALLVRAGSGVATFGIPDSFGIPEPVAAHTLVVPYNDEEALESVFTELGDTIACFILEPIAGNMGLVPPLPGYLQKARDLTRRYGSLLVFDEVMTGFRVSPGGAAQLYGVIPDLVCFGKIIGGGAPVGALAGKAEIMENLAPVGNVYHAGTLSGNPLSMMLGLATLEQIACRGEKLYRELESQSAALASGIGEIASRKGVPVQVQRVGSMLTVFFTEHPVRNYEEAKKSDTTLFSRFFQRLLECGVHLPPSQFECWFLTASHDQKIVETTLDACEKALGTL
jgi:glutamate-1-semialdehyde 2,1-aminomutase